MNQKSKLIKVFFNCMGALLVVCLLSLAITGAWQPASLRESAPALAPGSLQRSDTNSASPLTIVVDAGHGGSDGGACSADGTPEAGLNLAVAKMVESGLREAGFTVIMTRTNNDAIGKDKRKDMEARRAIMRKEEVAAIVSVHMNKFRDTTIHGPMAFYMKGSEEGMRLATCVIESVCLSINNPKRPANPGDYFVLRESIAPAVIIECGFLSNASDAQLLQDKTHQQKLSDGIVAGIAAYFSGNLAGTTTAE